MGSSCRGAGSRMSSLTTSCVLWGEQLTRPTTSFARGCKLWSRERQFYEQERNKNMVAFQGRPYLLRQYPELSKHYPGTWRVVGTEELAAIVTRLTQPTSASVSRADDIQERAAYVRFIVDREKAKDITYRRTAQSADPRLQGHDKTNNLVASTDFRRKYMVNRKHKKAAWTDEEADTGALPSL